MFMNMKENTKRILDNIAVTVAIVTLTCALITTILN